METGSAERILAIRYSEILDSPEAEDLLREYSRECSISEIGPTDPQRHIYDSMEAMGLMYSFGAYKNGVLVGFATLLVFVLPHYGKKIANVESLFVAKKYRRNFGLRLMTELERFAKDDMQCYGMLYNARSGTRLERFLDAMPKYQRTNSVFLRMFA